MSRYGTVLLGLPVKHGLAYFERNGAFVDLRLVSVPLPLTKRQLVLPGCEVRSNAVVACPRNLSQRLVERILRSVDQNLLAIDSSLLKPRDDSF